jgi:leukotriene-A4 hydrolase
MTESQTACKNRKYLFSQCEDILCRSVAPLQDTPANRITYSANVTVDEGYDVRMSANRTSNGAKDGKAWFYYNNTIRMPSYLIALAVGDLRQ